MSGIQEKLTGLTDLHPEVEQIEFEEKRVSKLLDEQAFGLLPARQALMILCRRDIVKRPGEARTERDLIRTSAPGRGASFMPASGSSGS
jgi:hypothetical protein